MEDSENTTKKGSTVVTVRVPNDVHERCSVRLARNKKESFQSILLTALEKYATTGTSTEGPISTESTDEAMIRKLQSLIKAPKSEVHETVLQALRATLKEY